MDNEQEFLRVLFERLRDRGPLQWRSKRPKGSNENEYVEFETDIGDFQVCLNGRGSIDIFTDGVRVYSTHYDREVVVAHHESYDLFQEVSQKRKDMVLQDESLESRLGVLRRALYREPQPSPSQ